MIAPSPDLQGFSREFLALEAQASAPYSHFVYGTPEHAAAARDLLFSHGVGEFVPPVGKLLVIGARPAGMVACLTGAELRRRRLAAAVVLARSGLWRSQGTERLVRIAGATLLSPADDDFYLSRIAVAPEFRGQGIGTELIRFVLDEAAAAGCTRCVLEVAPESGPAISRYKKCGFEETDLRTAEDPITGRRLQYIHMERPLS